MTLAIAVACVGVLLWMKVGTMRVERGIQPILERAATIAKANPSVRLCPPLARLVDSVQPGPATDGDLDPQAEADALCDQAIALVEAHPAWKYGDIPARGGVLTLFTATFLHAGWLHLLFNLWFFALCGMNLEDRWGRAVFAGFYLTAGAAGSLAERLASPASGVPGIGASGAIAGAMGGFLVCFAATRIRFGFWMGTRIGTFRAPAWAMLPLWLAAEVVRALLFAGRDGVGHWAHIGGFAYGVVIAGVLRASGIDRRLDDAVENAGATMQDRRIVKAGELVDARREREAFALLDEVAREQPANVDAQLVMLRAARAARDAAREDGAYRRLVELYLDRGEPLVAADLFDELHAAGRARDLPRSTALRLAGALVSAGEPKRAWTVYGDACHEGIIDAVSARSAFARARVAVSLRLDREARALLEAVDASAHASEELKRLAREELAKLGGGAIELAI